MPPQKDSHPFPKARMHADLLAEQFHSFTAEIIANVRFTQFNPRIVESPLLSLARQSERVLGDFQLRLIGTPSDLCHSFSIHIPALKIHGGVGSGRILTQDPVEGDEPLQNILPGSLADRL